MPCARFPAISRISSEVLVLRFYWLRDQYACGSGTGVGRAVAARSRIGICRTRGQRHSKTNRGSHALACRSLDRRRLGFWIKRGARSTGRHHRSALRRADPFSQRRIPNRFRHVAHSSDHLLISAAFAPFVFLGGSLLALVGMIFWGIGMSAQGSLFQAMLTGVIPAEKRSTAFGLFDTGYGIAWFLGSAAMGLLYDKSILAVVLFSVLLQIAALPVLYVANKSR